MESDHAVVVTPGRMVITVPWLDSTSPTMTGASGPEKASEYMLVEPVGRATADQLTPPFTLL